MKPRAIDSLPTIETLRARFDYDPDTGRLYWKVRASKRTVVGSRAGGPRPSDGYWRVAIKGRQYLVSRIAWALYHGEWPTQMIDHINGRVDDDRMANLRLATAAQNRGNQAPSVRNTSGYLGITWNAKRGKWQAKISKSGRCRSLGYFKEKEEAARVYAEAAREIRGEFVRS